MAQFCSSPAAATNEWMECVSASWCLFWSDQDVGRECIRKAFDAAGSSWEVPCDPVLLVACSNCESQCVNAPPDE